MLTVALPKGRLLPPVLRCLLQAGVSLAVEVQSSPRRLVFQDGLWRLVVVKDADVPAYVEQGVADLGFVGLDQILEHGGDVLRLLPMNFGHCRLCLLALANGNGLPSSRPLRLATKYPRLARKLLAERGLWAEVIKLSGSVELAATLKLADVVLDLVETGQTLKENGLVILETWLSVVPYLVVNRGMWETSGEETKAAITRLGGAYEDRGSQ